MVVIVTKYVHNITMQFDVSADILLPSYNFSAESNDMLVDMITIVQYQEKRVLKIYRKLRFQVYPVHMASHILYNSCDYTFFLPHGLWGKKKTLFSDF